VFLEPDAPTFEYRNDPDLTASVHRGRAFTLGDVGYMDAEGYLFLRDRGKDMIISGGVNIYPAEVEAVLTSHPAVADVAVIGVPDAEWGEAVKAVVQPANGCFPSSDLEHELIELLPRQSGPLQVPAYGRFPGRVAPRRDRQAVQAPAARRVPGATPARLTLRWVSRARPSAYPRRRGCRGCTRSAPA